jgi:rhodanese-related sulfurtransferase
MNKAHPLMKKLLVFGAAAFVAAAVYAAQFPDITINELKSAMAAKKVTLIDANGSDSWKEGHILGAIDFSANRDKLATALPKDKKALVVAYCGGPRCQAYQAAAKAAEKLGYTNVKHLVAGISGWQEAGEKMEKAK